VTADQLVIEHLARTRFADLPGAAVDHARLAILDTLGVAFAGTARPEIRPAIELVLAHGGRPESTVLGAGVGLPAPQAAFANGVLARAWDFDDIFKLSPAAGHASVNVVPAALAVAERIGTVSGPQLLTAVALAEDLFCRLSLATKTEANQTGRYCMFAVFAPAAAAAKLLALPPPAIAHALGIAYAQAAGEMQKYQTSALTIVLQNGFVPMAGVLAGLLAQGGASGAADVFTGRHGFFRVFEPEHDLDGLIRGLGAHYVGPELSPKAYPCCSCSHTSIEAALHLTRTHDVQPDRIAAIRIGVNRAAFESTCIPRPLKWNPPPISPRQFSLPYCVAAAFVDRSVTVRSFLPEPARGGAIWRLLERTTAHIDPEIEAAFGHLADGPGRVTVRLDTGAEHSRLVEYERGHVKNPMTWDDVVIKFQGCCETAGLPGDGPSGELVGLLSELDTLHDLTPLWSLLRGRLRRA